MTNEVDSLLSRLSHEENEKEKNKLKLDSLVQEVAFMNSKLAATSNDHKTQKSRWLAEKTELEGKLFQLIATQTQFQGTLRKKEKEFEKLQAYLQKQVTSSNNSTTKPKLSSNTTSSSIRNSKLPSNTNSTNATSETSCIVISKPLPTNTTQNNVSNSSILAKDLEIMTFKQIINDLQSENKEIKIKLNQFSNENNDSLGTNNVSNSSNIRDILMLQSKLVDMEQLVNKTKTENEELAKLCRKRDRELISAEINETKPTNQHATTNNNNNNTISSSSVVLPTPLIATELLNGNNKELEKENQDLKRQLQDAWVMINKQDALVHQGIYF